MCSDANITSVHVTATSGKLNIGWGYGRSATLVEIKVLGANNDRQR
jgi:hypothetical protein